MILIGLILFVVDQGIGSILHYFYFRQKYGVLYRTTYAMDSTRADILVFGSSRANHHYVPDIFEDSLHCTCYNTGRDGNFILYNYAIFKAITNRYQPSLIVMDVNSWEIIYDPNSYERLSSLLPYYKDHNEIRGVVAHKSPFEKVKLFSSIYPYNSLPLTIALGNLVYNKKRNKDTKGYLPVFRKMKNEKLADAQNDNMRTEIRVDDNKITALNDIMETCKQRKIKLLFVQSPVYSMIYNTFCDSVISALCTKNEIGFLNLPNQDLFINNPNYFVDRNHLNDKGARVFSNIVVRHIKKTQTPL
jgi:hypothetical protein